MISLKLKTFFQVAFLVYIAGPSGISCGDLPPEIEKCVAADTDCIVKTINKVLRTYPKGEPSFGLQPLDEIQIENVVVAEGDKDQPISMNLKFNSLAVKGFEKCVIERVVGFEKDPYTAKFEVYGKAPLFILSGQYEMDGKVLLLPMKGKGLAHIDLTGVTYGLKVKCDVEKRNGKHYMTVKKVKFSLQTTDCKVNFQNLFDGNQELGDSINKVINENWREVWNGLQNGINNAVSKVITGLLKNILKELSYDDFYKAD